MITNTIISPAAAEARCRRVLAKENLRLRKATPQHHSTLGAYYTTDSNNHVKRGWMSLQDMADDMADDLGVLHLTCFGREVIGA